MVQTECQTGWYDATLAFLNTIHQIVATVRFVGCSSVFCFFCLRKSRVLILLSLQTAQCTD